MKIKTNITVETMFKNYNKTIHLFIDSSIENSEVVLVFERNNAHVKKL
jgi:hypothetical protein